MAVKRKYNSEFRIGERLWPTRHKKVAGGKKVSERFSVYPEKFGYTKSKCIALFIKDLKTLSYNDRQDIDWSGTPMQEFVDVYAIWAHSSKCGGAKSTVNLIDGGQRQRNRELRAG
jgi:hypothetical protein